MSVLTYDNSLKLKVALGHVHGWSFMRKFGQNPSVAGTSTNQDVWPLGTVRTLPSSAGTVSISSSSANDDADPAGTGAWTVTMQGLDTNYHQITETVSLNGTSTVTSSKSFLRLNTCFVATAGTGNFNAGNITFTIGGNAQAYISTNRGQTAQCMYTVPADYYLAIDNYRWHIGRMTGSTDIQVLGFIKLDGSNAWRAVSNIRSFGPDSWDSDDAVTLLPPKTEVRMTTVSSGATNISGIFSGYLIRADAIRG